MMILVKIIVFIVMISVIVCVHEFGHFYFAKKAGVLCHEFSIGMGPAIYKKKKGETTYCIRCIPIGGYVSMAGEQVTEDMIKVGDIIGLNLSDGMVSELVLSDKLNADIRGKVVRRELYGKHGEPLEIELETDDVTKCYPVKADAYYVDEKSKLQIAPYNRSFESKTLWQRFLSIFAGPFMNFVLAIIIYLICAFIVGTPNTKSSVIGSIDSNYPAYGILQKNDQILEVKDQYGKIYSIKTWDDFGEAMSEATSNGSVKTTIKVKRDGQETWLDPIDNYVVINSIGLSNIGVDRNFYKTEPTIVGARVGEVGLRYKKDVDDNVAQLSKGDIITAIQVIEKNKNESYSEDAWINVDSWTVIINELKDVSYSEVYFKYYDYYKTDTEDGFKELRNTYSDKQVIESYTDEVLNNQRVDKIKVYVGVSPTYHHNFFEMVGSAFRNFWSDFTLIFRTLKLLIWPNEVRQVGVSNLSGFVGIFDMLGGYISQGVVAILLFAALISVNIGVMNLLPIPALDGGRILFLIIEGITRKPVNRKVETIINNVVFILLMIFMVYVTFNDIMRIFK